MKIEIGIKQTIIFDSVNFYGEGYDEDYTFEDFKEVLIDFLYENPEYLLNNVEFKKI